MLGCRNLEEVMVDELLYDKVSYLQDRLYQISYTLRTSHYANAQGVT